jgi:hypothetical protein
MAVTHVKWRGMRLEYATRGRFDGLGLKTIDEARNHLKMEFEMKDLGQTKFCLGLQLEHLHTRILMHQSAYIYKVLEKFNMDKSYPSKTPMVGRSLELKTDQFRP